MDEFRPMVFITKTEFDRLRQIESEYNKLKNQTGQKLHGAGLTNNTQLCSASVSVVSSHGADDDLSSVASTSTAGNSSSDWETPTNYGSLSGGGNQNIKKKKWYFLGIPDKQ